MEMKELPDREDLQGRGGSALHQLSRPETNASAVPQDPEVPPDPPGPPEAQETKGTQGIPEAKETPETTETLEDRAHPDLLVEMEILVPAEPPVDLGKGEGRGHVDDLDPMDDPGQRDPQETPDDLETKETQDHRDQGDLLDRPVLPVLLVNPVVEDNPVAQERTPSTAHAQGDQGSSKLTTGHQHFIATTKCSRKHNLSVFHGIGANVFLLIFYAFHVTFRSNSFVLL
jgi:hypothetical protein